MSGRCWVPGAADGPYDVDNLPYAVFSDLDTGDAGDGGDPAGSGDDTRDDIGGDIGGDARVGARVGDLVVDLASLAAIDALEVAALLAQPSLAPLMAAGPAVWAATRTWLQDLLTDEAERDLVEPALRPLASVRLHLPAPVADYVDFYCSEHHATRVGELFRPGDEPLPPQWRHLPVGYHGRAGSVVLSGTHVRRPCGQRRGEHGPVFGPTERLDLEAELGFWVGVPTSPGTRLSPDDLAEHVFGVSLVNDWSARDVQAWEYVPLGPMLAKSFATSVSAWVTPLAALEAARVDLPGQAPPPLPHLAVDAPAGYDIDVEVRLDDTVIARPPYASIYWSPGQMLAHLTSNGAALRTGDLFASGTISGSGDDQRGCLLELTYGGRQPIALPDGSSRGFLGDGDTVTLTATAPGARGGRIALGEVRGRVLPADAG